MSKQNKNKYGQYFTPRDVTDFIVDLASINKSSAVLEPCCGEGVFLEALMRKGYKNIKAYEIDASLTNIFTNNVIYKSFISENFTDKFNLIIGNPPYIRWANLETELKKELINNELWNKYFNSLCDYLYIFILKSIELLEDNGELIFICPEYWLNTTHSQTLRDYMVSKGYFECIYHFNETPIFDNVTVSIVIFKYVKSKLKKGKKINITKYYSSQRVNNVLLNKLKNKEKDKNIDFFEIDQFKIGERWILAPDETKIELRNFEIKCSENGMKSGLFEENVMYHTIGEICDIGNGLVSGLDKAFQLNGQKLNEKESNSIINVIKAKDLNPFFYNGFTKYIFLENIKDECDLIENYPNFYSHFTEYTDDLILRYQYNKSIPYWEWVFLRNYNLFSKKSDKIFVPCKERISNKNYFRFAYVTPDIYPTQDVTAIFKKEGVKESIYYILALLNNHRTFNWLKHNGIVKGNIVEFSEKPISSIPVKRINWDNEKEVELHEKITALCKSYISIKEKDVLVSLEDNVDKLF